MQAMCYLECKIVILTKFFINISASQRLLMLFKCKYGGSANNALIR